MPVRHRVFNGMRYVLARRLPVPELADNQFELVGDPKALPDAFFDALAALLLAAEETSGPTLPIDTPLFTEEIYS